MSRWQDIRVDGLGAIERVVAIFRVGSPSDRLPFPSFKVKVIERADDSLLAVPNVAVRGADGNPDWISGLGDTVEEALEDALRHFVSSLDNGQEFSDSDFVWSDPIEF